MIVAGRDQARGRDTVAAIERDGGQAAFVPADLSTREGAERLAAEASRVFGSIEIMVNNAGTFSFGPTAATTEAAYDGTPPSRKHLYENPPRTAKWRRLGTVRNTVIRAVRGRPQP